MTVRKGDIVVWRGHPGGESLPCIVVRGPREGYNQHGRLTEIVTVVDIFDGTEVLKNIPLNEVCQIQL